MVWSALLLGLFSSLHCIGMCAPLQAITISAYSRKRGKRHLVLYHLSRIATYGMLGLLAGTLGRGLGLQNWQQQTSLLAGLLLLFAFAGFYLLKLDRKLFKVIFPYLSRVRGQLQKKRSTQALYSTGSGVLNGLLPCGMVYLAIFPAIGSESIAGAGMYMLLFGLGTLPLLILANLGTMSLFQRHYKIIQRIIPTMVVITALLLIFRGAGLGIPYLSPDLPGGPVSKEACR